MIIVIIYNKNYFFTLLYQFCSTNKMINYSQNVEKKKKGVLSYNLKVSRKKKQVKLIDKSKPLITKTSNTNFLKYYLYRMKTLVSCSRVDNGTYCGRTLKRSNRKKNSWHIGHFVRKISNTFITQDTRKLSSLTSSTRRSRRMGLEY